MRALKSALDRMVKFSNQRHCPRRRNASSCSRRPARHPAETQHRGQEATSPDAWCPHARGRRDGQRAASSFPGLQNERDPAPRERGSRPSSHGVSSSLMLAHGPARLICCEEGRERHCPRSPMRRPSPCCTARGFQCSDLVRGPVLHLPGGRPALPLRPALPSGKVTRPAGSGTWPR